MAQIFGPIRSRGVYAYTYYARATTAGSFRVPPANTSEKYFPELFAHSDGGLFSVVEP